MDFDFIVAVKRGATHVLPDHMSRIPNGEAPIVVEDDLLDAPLFMLNHVLEWTEEIFHYLANGLPTKVPSNKARARRLIRDAATYQLIVRQLYKTRKDGIVR